MQNKSLTKKLSLILVAALLLASSPASWAGSFEEAQTPTSDVARGIGDLALQTLNEAGAAGIDFQDNDVLRSMANLGQDLPQTLEKSPSMIRFVHSALLTDKGVNMNALHALNKLPLEKRMEILKNADKIAQQKRAAEGQRMPSDPKLQGQALLELTRMAGGPHVPWDLLKSGQLKLGLPSKSSPIYRAPSLHSLRFSKYGALLPAAPLTGDETGGIGPKDWDPMGNLDIGDCALACPAHQIMAWTASVGNLKKLSLAQVLAAYSAISGYKPGHPSTDVGANPEDVLNYWHTTGIGGDTIDAWVALKLKNFNQLKEAAWIFGSAYLAMDLPLAWQGANIWDAPQGAPRGKWKPGSWGGHAIPVVAWNENGFAVVTWGAIMWVTWAAWNIYGSGIWVAKSQDWLKNGKTPNNGFDDATLQTDMNELPNQAANGQAQRGRKKSKSSSMISAPSSEFMGRFDGKNAVWNEVVKLYREKKATHIVILDSKDDSCPVDHGGCLIIPGAAGPIADVAGFSGIVTEPQENHPHRKLFSLKEDEQVSLYIKTISGYRVAVVVREK